MVVRTTRREDCKKWGESGPFRLCWEKRKKPMTYTFGRQSMSLRVPYRKTDRTKYYAINTRNLSEDGPRKGLLGRG